MNTSEARLAGGQEARGLRRALLGIVLGVAGLGLVAHGGINGGGRTKGKTSTKADTTMTVAGVEYDFATALVTVNGEPATVDSIAPGQVVTVDVAPVAEDGAAVAVAVDHSSDVSGPVTAISSRGLVVLGQTVLIDQDTIVDLGTTTLLQALPIAAAQWVDVSGFRDASGQLLATRIERVSLTSVSRTAQVVGIVSKHDPYSLRFSINGLQVDYSAVQMLNQSFGNGTRVMVQGRRSGNQLIATFVTRLDAALGGEESEAGSVAGIVTGGLSGGVFVIDGQPVLVRSTTRISGGSKSALQAGARVHVEGSFDAAGRIVAQTVAFGFD